MNRAIQNIWRIRDRRAFSVMEYCALVIIVLGILIVMKTVIFRGLAGNYKNTGDSFAFGRQFDPDNTIECAYDYQANGSGRWYDLVCYDYEYALCFKDPNRNQCPDGDMLCRNDPCRAYAVGRCIIEAMCDT